jgi:hypothetical protein
MERYAAVETVGGGGGGEKEGTRFPPHNRPSPLELEPCHAWVMERATPARCSTRPERERETGVVHARRVASMA